ncbi:MFS transporter [Kribbella sp. NPDC020789]
MYWRRITELPRWVRAVMLGQLVSAAGSLAWLYLTLYLVQDRGMSAQDAGFAAAAYGVGLVAGNLGGGWVGDRFGLRTAAVAGQVSWAIACAAMPLAPDAWLAALGALAGLCGGATRPNLSALVAVALPADRRREGIALSRTASNAGFALGPPLGGLVAAYNFSLVFVFDAVSSLVLAFVVWRWVPAARRAPKVPGLGGALLRDRSLLVLLAMIVVVDTACRQIYVTMPLLLRDAGSAPVAYGVLIAVNSIVIVCFEAPLAIRLRGHRALRVIGAGSALVGMGLAFLGVWPALFGAAVAIVVITAGEMLYKPTATAHVADVAPEGMVGRYSSLYAAASVSGMFLAPALGGVVYQHTPGLLFPLAGGLAAAAGVVLALIPPAAAPAALPSASTVRRSSAS